jgi:hypothetical protein
MKGQLGIFIVFILFKAHCVFNKIHHFSKGVFVIHSAVLIILPKEAICKTTNYNLILFRRYFENLLRVSVIDALGSINKIKLTPSSIIVF